MNTESDILRIASENQQKAWEIIESTDIINIWKSIGAQINLVGSLKTGLLMKNLDIDFHVYSDPLDIKESFKAIARLAENPSIKHIDYRNLIETDEKCIEWHAWYEDTEDRVWQLDMIHILKGSFYDGYFEKVADRISAVLTEEMKTAILTLKYNTPETEKIFGIEYYQAVIRDGIRNYSDLEAWRKKQPDTRIIKWMP